MDRNYWRTAPDRQLIEEARTKGCELCIALAERLEDNGPPDSELTAENGKMRSYVKRANLELERNKK